MNRYLERVLSHATSILQDMIAAEHENPMAQRKLREAIALIYGASDAIESVGEINREVSVGGQAGPRSVRI